MPINPKDLLVALHVLDSDKKDKETVSLREVMGAIDFCMEQKREYSQVRPLFSTRLLSPRLLTLLQDTLAITLQQLIDVSPLPALLMRTVIKTVHAYPELTGFVMGLLVRLITKQVSVDHLRVVKVVEPTKLLLAQVWTNKLLWKGWIKCCSNTVPHSYHVILQVRQAFPLALLLFLVSLTSGLPSCPRDNWRMCWINSRR